jgi:hypothetical protein
MEGPVSAPHETSIAPEVRLIAERRKFLVPRMSPDRAAKLAEERVGGGFSGSTWRKIESGTSRATDDKLAMMALIVGVLPEDLEEVDRPEAAHLLRGLMEEPPGSRKGARPSAAVEREVAANIAELTELLMRATPEVREAIMTMLRSMEAQVQDAKRKP